MEVPVIAAIIAGLVSLVSAAGTLWSSARTNANANAIKLLEIESDRQNPLLSAKSEISNFSEPLPRSAYDLQSRLYNIMRRNLIQVYFVRGDERTKSYVVNNTVYLVAQFQRITELMRQKRSNLSTLERAREHANSCSYKIKYAAFGEPMNIPLCCAFLRGNKELSVKPRLSGRTAALSAWGTVPF